MQRRIGSWKIVAAGVLLAVGAVSTSGAEERVLEIGRWYPSLESGLTLTQSVYSDNWSGGDKGSIVWTFITNAGLESQLRENVNWNNTLKLAFGQTHQQTANAAGERSWERPEKSTDLVDLETVLRLTLGRAIDPVVSARLETQFQDASDVQGRTLSFNPLKIKGSAGIARQIFNEDNRNLLTRLGFAYRWASRRLFTGDAPDWATDAKSTNDGGIEWVTDTRMKLLNNRVSWTSKLTVFQPVFYSEKDSFDNLTAADLAANDLDADLADYTMAPDIDWENIFTSQITKILSVNLYLRWVYDKYDNSVPAVVSGDGTLANPSDLRAATRKSVQIKQTLALGLTYRFL